MTSRRSFLIAMFEGGGNVPLILPAVARLVARGSEVTVLAGPNIRRPSATSPSAPFLDKIAATGSTIATIPAPEVHPLAEVSRRGLAFGWTPPLLTAATGVALTSRWSSPWAAAVMGEATRTPFDVLVADFFLMGALAAGERLGVPTVALVHTVNWPVDGIPAPGTGLGPASTSIERVRDAVLSLAYRRIRNRNGLPSLNRTRQQLGLEPLRSVNEQFATMTRVLMLCSRAFDLPNRRLPDNMRYVGTPFDDGIAESWESPWASDDARPLVLVSLSTLPQGQGPLMRRILAAVDGMPIRALVTLGPSLDPAGLSIPSNAHVATFVPHAAVLPHVAAVVTQCGLSTVTKALLNAVPLVCLPLLGDQPDNAVRVAALGAGIQLRPDAAPAEIAHAIARVLSEPTFSDAARRMSVVLQNEDGGEATAVELESLARTSG